MKWFIIFIIFRCMVLGNAPVRAENSEGAMIDIQERTARLRKHVKILTETIGERSLFQPQKLERAAGYIESFYREIGVPVHREPYRFYDMQVANIVAEIACGAHPSKVYLVGAHYDSVNGTVGADDNASAIAVQLESARLLQALAQQEALDLAVRFVSFALEEPPVFGTRFMGSRVFARQARKTRQQIDGMICLEMVGYTCHVPGCQGYPFPLMFLGYPKTGNFIGIVGNFKSRGLTSELSRAFRRNPELPVVRLTVPLGGWLQPAVRLSDHAAFWDQGYKAVMITDSAFYRNPHYHRASDTMDTLDYGFMAELVESLLIFFRSHHRR